MGYTASVNYWYTIFTLEVSIVFQSLCMEKCRILEGEFLQICLKPGFQSTSYRNGHCYRCQSHHKFRGPLYLPMLNSLVSPTKQLSRLEMPFETRVSSRNHVLDVAAHWRRLASTIDRSMCNGDAALCPITVTTCLHK